MGIKISREKLDKALYVASLVALVALGIVSTLAYQNFVTHIKADGVREYKAVKCHHYSDPKSKIIWMECDE